MHSVVTFALGRDHQKRYRFTPSVSIWRMPDALSVDALCGFGAKNLQDVLDSYSLGTSVVGYIRLFRAFAGVRGQCWLRDGARSVSMSLVSAVLAWVGTVIVKPGAFAGMLPACRLVRCPSGWPLS
ncbi:hypothetical protein EMIT0215P_70193 [Pseudomonas serboccidentalis]